MSKFYPRMHVSLYVSDIQKTIDFYTLFFDKAPEKIEAGYTKFILDRPSLIISFIENASRVNQNFGHLGFQVESAERLQSHMSYAEKKGLLTRKEMNTACCYAIQDKFWVNDPDGIQWEVYYFHEDTSFNDPHFEAHDSEACCITPTESHQNQTIVKATVQKTEETCTPGSGCC